MITFSIPVWVAVYALGVVTGIVLMLALAWWMTGKRMGMGGGDG